MKLTQLLSLYKKEHNIKRMTEKDRQIFYNYIFNTYYKQNYKLEYTFNKEQQSLSIKHPFDVIACPRPRVTRNGQTYYDAKYKYFKQYYTNELAQIAQITDGMFYVGLPMLLKIWVAYSGDKAYSDVDNLAKTVLDALQMSKIIEDDKWIFDLSVVKGNDVHSIHGIDYDNIDMTEICLMFK